MNGCQLDKCLPNRAVLACLPLVSSIFVGYCFGTCVYLLYGSMVSLPKSLNQGDRESPGAVINVFQYLQSCIWISTIICFMLLTTEHCFLLSVCKSVLCGTTTVAASAIENCAVIKSCSFYYPFSFLVSYSGSRKN